MALHNYTIRGKEKKTHARKQSVQCLALYDNYEASFLPSFLPEITASGSAAPNSAMQSGDGHRHGTPYY
jgi:hypothetical protein